MKDVMLISPILLLIALLAPPAFAEEGLGLDPSEGRVGRSGFTTGIDQREPIDEITSLRNDVRKIIFFSEIRELTGQTVTHRWEYDGKVMAEIPFNIGGSIWRTWSSKNLLPGWLGVWKVSVLDPSGKTIGEKNFTYLEADQAP
ncbi:MAG: DUF2914 domain-containing protein [Nitrospiria bacterium]